MKTGLRAIRKAHGYTQEQLAKAVGASTRQIGAWERSENELPMDYACTIADVLGCSLDDIACRVDCGSARVESGDERELAEIYGSVTPEGQRALMASARGIAATYSKNNNNKVPKAS